MTSPTMTAGPAIPSRPLALRPRRPVAVLIAAGFLVLVVLAAAFAPLVAPYAPDAIDLSSSLVGTGGDAWSSARPHGAASATTSAMRTASSALIAASRR